MTEKLRDTYNRIQILFLFYLDLMASRKKDELSEILVDSTETHAENSGSHLQDPPTSTKTRHLVVLCILVVELCERLTFYGVTANLVFYCKDILKLASPLPSTITLAFQGTMSV